MDLGGYVIEGDPLVTGEAPSITDFMQLDTEVTTLQQDIANALVNNTQTLNIASSTTQTLNIGSSTAMQTINIGTGGNNSKTINIGASSDTINLQGTTLFQNVTNLDVKDKLININEGGSASSGFDAGFEIEENGSTAGYVKTSADRSAFHMKVPSKSTKIIFEPNTNNDITINQSSHDPVSLPIGESNLVLNNQVLNTNSTLTSLISDTKQLIVRGDDNVQLGSPSTITTNLLKATSSTNDDVCDIQAIRQVATNFTVQNGTNLSLNRTAGKVGIGKIPTTSRLEVSGDVDITGTYKVNGSPFVTSQWTTSGNNIYNNNTQHVGIGTSQPIRKLSIKSSGTDTAMIAFHKSNDDIPYVACCYDETNDGFAIKSNVGTTDINTSQFIVNRTTGNVGIGRTVAGYLLDIAGPIVSQPILCSRYKSGTQPIAHDTSTVINFDSAATNFSTTPPNLPFPILFQTNGEYKNVNAPVNGRQDTLTVTVDCTVVFQSNSSGFRQIAVVKNTPNSTTPTNLTFPRIQNAFLPAAGNGFDTILSMCCTFKLGWNESFYISAWHNANQNVNIYPGWYATTETGSQTRLNILIH